MDRKPIVIIINKLAVGGAERLVVDDINELIKRKIEVRLITLRPESRQSLSPQVNLDKRDWKVINFNSLLDVSALLQLVRILKEWQPRVIITHLWFANTVGRIAGKLAYIPCIISFEHNVYDEIKSRKQFLIDTVLQVFSSKIVAVSSVVKDSLVRHFISPKKISVILNRVDIERYKNIRPNIQIRKSIGIEEEEFCYLFIGRLVKQKGVDTLIRAFAKVPKGKLLIVGDGEGRSKLESLARELNISKDVYFLGVRDDIPDIFAASDCFVFPSRWEGVGIVVLEAFASGIPIILTNFDVVDEILKTGYVKARVVPIDDVERLASEMEKEQRNGRQKHITQKGIAEFAIERHVDSLLELIDSCLKK